MTLGDASYPQSLLHMEDPPLLLYGMGAPAAWGPQFWDAPLTDDEQWTRAVDLEVGAVRCAGDGVDDLVGVGVGVMPLPLRKAQGITGEALLQILESRLDNVAYRMGFGASRSEARQVKTGATRHSAGLAVAGATFMDPHVSVGQVATYPARAANLPLMLESVASQLDEVHVVLNQFTRALRRSLPKRPMTVRELR